MTQKKHLSWACLLLLLLLSSHFSKAQYAFHQSFTQSQVLSQPGWKVHSPDASLKLDTVNGFTRPGNGALKESFFDLRGGEIDTLITPLFSATAAGDTLYFEHAHVMRLFSNGVDSMHIMTSNNGGQSFTLFHSYQANPFAILGSLSTVPQPNFGFFPVDFVPTSGDWRSATLTLPSGINRIAFVFFAGGGNSLYMDNIRIGRQPAQCSGAPMLGNLNRTTLSCIGKQFALTPDSFEYNPFITYQWKQSLDSGNTFPWTNVSGAIGSTSPELFKIHNGNMYYRLEATCTTSSLTSYTAGTRVINDSFYNCYCNENLGGGCNPMFSTPDIVNFRFPSGNLNNVSWCTGNANVSYTKFPIGPTSFDSIPAGHPMFPVEVSIDENLANAALWIDYNRDGSFDSTEYHEIANGFNARGPATANLNIPAITTGGLTGMRLRVYETFSTPILDSNDACTFNNTGETEDYFVYIKPAVPCSGAPQAGNINQTSWTICSGDKIKLNSTGYSYGAGITYTWEESDDNGNTDPWTTVSAGGASGIHTPELFTSATDTIYYRLKVHCSNTNSSSYSSVITVYTKPFYACYCQNNIGGAGCDPRNPYISQVVLSSTSINNISNCSNNPENYSYFGLASNAHDTVFKGQQLTLTVTTKTANTIIGAWIDYDKDSIYESDEFINVSAFNITDSSARVTFIIPDTTTVSTGYTGMRIRAAASSAFLSDRDACTQYNEGETEDYVLLIQASPSCNGAPVAGLLGGSKQVCSGDSLKLTSLGSSYGSGLTYTWQESDDRGQTDPWANVTTGSGFNTREFNTSVITDTIYYRLLVTCTNTNTTTISDTLAVFIKPIYLCYCNTNLGGGAGSACSSGNYITNVSISGGNLNNNSSCYLTTANGNYSQYLPSGTATDSVFAGGYYTLSVQTNSDNDAVAAWIDFNHNGIFEASEYQLLTLATISGVPSTASFMIPGGAHIGYTGMRIKSDCNTCNSIGASEACTAMSFGETEDYVIYIKPAPTCTGTPTAANIGLNTLVCRNTPFTLSSPGSTFGSGIVYQWEESDDNGNLDPWANVTGMQGRTDTTRVFTSNGIAHSTYYRMSVTCQHSSATAYTNAVKFDVDSFYNCYTTTANFGGGSCSMNANISEVTIRGTDLNNSSSCNTHPINGVYSKFPGSGRSTATLVRNSVYQLEVKPSGFMSQNVGVWIDFNRNGSFENSEFTNIGNGSLFSPASGSIVISTSPGVTGPTGMRIRSRVSGWTMAMVNANDTTATYGDGEVEDYVITLDTLKPATGAVISQISNTEATVSWNRGNGNGVLVIARPASATAVAPTNNLSYRADNSMSGFRGDSTATGNYVVYTGTDTFTTIINMNPVTNYAFDVYEMIDNGTFSVYYSTIASTTNGTTLPVELTHFEASPVDGNVLLKWTTASETNHAGFNIERSVNATHFESIGYVKGEQYKSTATNYSLIDKGAFEQTGSNKLYYRLQQTDLDGKFAYSKVIAIENKTWANAEMKLHPNPSAGKVSLSWNLSINKFHLVVTDVSGRIVADKTYEHLTTVQSIELNELSHLEKGIYFVTVSDGTTSKTLRLIKQ